MRSALIHGILLAVMLVYGYRTWTRDKTIKPDIGKVVLWDKAEADLVSIELTTEKKVVRLEQRSDANGAYWWGTETTIEKKPKPVDPAAGSAGSGSAGSGSAGSGSAGSAGSAAPPAPEMIETKKVREFPLGEAGTKLLKNYFAARALRDLGKPADAAKKEYKLTDAKTTLTVTFKDGKRTFLVGGSVYGGSDRYVVDQASGNAYVLSKDLVANLETGESSMQLVDPKGFDMKLLDSVTIEAYGKKKDAARITTTDAEGHQKKVWGELATKKPNQTVGNFIDNTNNLKPTEYMAQLKPEQLTPIFKVTYKDAKGAPLGTLVLFKAETVAKTAEDGDLDPTAPVRTEVSYYVLTEKTRVPALVRKDTAQRAEQDLPLVFSDKPLPDKPTGPDVKGTPFENPPQPGDPHGHDAHGHGAPPPPPAGSNALAGSAAPTTPPAGSAAPKTTPPAGSASPKAPPPAGSAAPKATPPAGSAAPKATPPAGSAAAPKPTPPAPAPGSAATGHDGHAH